MSAPDAPNPEFIFYSADGIKLCREIAQKYLPYDPHDYSLEAVGHIAQGNDVLVRSGCASGKTGIIALLAIILLEFGNNPSAIPGATRQKFVKDPAIVVICPTNALEVDIETKLAKLKIKAIAINAALLAAAETDLWTQAAVNATVILLSPEKLGSTDHLVDFEAQLVT
ncbi:hypothetical protein C8J56DRAFT_181498 [Mycena floridula]|nr:hypothetical protein C8J56DRAFT_181498 [Mycena floridula]